MSSLNKNHDNFFRLTISVIGFITIISIFLINNQFLYKYMGIYTVITLAITTILLVFIREHLKFTTNTLEYIDNNFYYIKYEPQYKKFFLSVLFQKYTDNYQGSHQDLNSIFEQKDLEKINTLFDLMIKFSKENKKFSTKLPLSLSFNGYAKHFICTPCVIYDQLGKAILYVVNFVEITQSKNQLDELNLKYNNALRDTELYKRLLDSLPIMVWYRDKDLNLEYSNKLATKFFNDNNTKDLQINDKSLSYQAMNELETITKNFKITINNRRELYKFNYYYDQSLNKSIVTSYEISEQEIAHRKLNSIIATQNQLLDNSSNPAAIFDDNRELNFYNQAFAKLWELDENWLETKPNYGVFLEKLREKRKLPEQANFQEFKNKQLNFFTELTETYNEFYHLPNGRSLRVIIIPYANGGLLFSYEDMTDLIKLESSYNKLINTQKVTLDNLYEGVCVFDENGKLTLYNNKFKNIWRLDNNFLNSKPHILEVIEKTSHYFEHQPSAKIHKDNVTAVLAKRTSLQEQLYCTNENVVTRIIVPMANGSCLLTDMDITDSVIIEKSLIAKNHLLLQLQKIKDSHIRILLSEYIKNLTIEDENSQLTSEYLGTQLTIFKSDIEKFINHYIFELPLNYTEYNTKKLFSNLNLNIKDIAEIPIKIDYNKFKFALENIIQANKSSSLQLKFANLDNLIKITFENFHLKDKLYSIYLDYLKIITEIHNGEFNEKDNKIEIILPTIN